MTEAERNELMDRLDEIDRRTAYHESEMDMQPCRCGRRECDRCDVYRALEHTVDDLRRDRLALLERFPEVRYDENEGCPQ